jgi:hypothetical protein
MVAGTTSLSADSAIPNDVASTLSERLFGERAMDLVTEFAIVPLRDFTKDSIRLLNKCTKPDRKGTFAAELPAPRDRAQAPACSALAALRPPPPQEGDPPPAARSIWSCSAAMRVALLARSASSRSVWTPPGQTGSPK